MFLNKDGKEINRQPCQVITRVMGYLRPVSQRNVGKKSEFYSRKYFVVEEKNGDIISNNKAFIAKYSTNAIPIT